MIESDDLNALANALAGAAIPDTWLAFRTTQELTVWRQAIPTLDAAVIGHSREGQPIEGWVCGHGAHTVSIVAGCHADEPAGPMTAQCLPLFLAKYAPDLLNTCRFFIVPQINPDGADRNRRWFRLNADLATYAAYAAREAPGDDIEYGFGTGTGSRPECEAAMAFLKTGRPYVAHFSLHGMGFAEGAWFLVARHWAERSGPLQGALKSVCRHMAMPLHDMDRSGEKGFWRIAPGFCTTPSAMAMRGHFTARGDRGMAARFQPSSMEFIESLGGNPLCFVTELPVFRIGAPRPASTATRLWELRDDLATARSQNDAAAYPSLAARYRLESVPFAVQVALQAAAIVLATAHALAEGNARGA